jgi:transcriptional regulator with XRE-family HTH domain
MDFNLEKFSYRLIVLMEEFNMTQIQLAGKIGTSNVTISRYLSGERVPRLEVITRIANVFHVSVDYLLGQSDTKETQLESGISDVDIAMSVSKLYKLKGNAHLSKSQIDLIKKILLANKDFILSA